MPSLDTNCLLRWLLGDDPEQTPIITDIINAEDNLVIADAAIIETVFVLEKVKKIERSTIEKAMHTLFERINISCNKELFAETLSIWAKHPKLSFVDCYLEAYVRKTGDTPLLTFDKKMGKQLESTKILIEEEPL